MPQECLSLASDERLAQLVKLDLSCNPIGYRGLLNLIQAKSSKLEKLEELEVFNADIEQSKGSTPIKQQKLKSIFHIKPKLKSLNLSYNNLGKTLA